MANILSIILLSAAVIIPKSIVNSIVDGPGDPGIIVTGDSYAVNFFFDEYKKNGKMECCAQPGRTAEENKEIMLSASDRFGSFILLSVGVNDQDRNTHPNVFKKHLKDVIDKAKSKNKIVFVHTYENAPFAFVKGVQFQSLDYDIVLRELVNEYDNVIYIDMSDCSYDKYFKEDGYHVNKEYNDILYERVLKVANEIIENVTNVERETYKS